MGIVPAYRETGIGLKAAKLAVTSGWEFRRSMKIANPGVGPLAAKRRVTSLPLNGGPCPLIGKQALARRPRNLR